MGARYAQHVLWVEPPEPLPPVSRLTAADDALQRTVYVGNLGAAVSLGDVNALFSRADLGLAGGGGAGSQGGAAARGVGGGCPLQ